MAPISSEDFRKHWKSLIAYSSKQECLFQKSFVKSVKIDVFNAGAA